MNTKTKTIKVPRIGTKAFRVFLARDVIKQINTGKLIAERMTYFKNDTVSHRFFISKENGKESLQDVLLEEDVAPCRVCALGALWASKVIHKNEAVIEDGLGSRRALDRDLRAAFSEAQIRLIEIYFEGFYGVSIYRDKHLEDEDRMIAIMKNIIKNRGEFIP